MSLTACPSGQEWESITKKCKCSDANEGLQEDKTCEGNKYKMNSNTIQY